MIEYADTWPSLWAMRHKPIRHPFMGMQRVCVTCSHLFTAGQYRAHLRSVAHRTNRGWWR